MISPEFIETAADSIAAGTQAATPVATEAKLSIWELCSQGGLLMIPLVLLSVVCIYIFASPAAVRKNPRIQTA